LVVTPLAAMEQHPTVPLGQLAALPPELFAQEVCAAESCDDVRFEAVMQTALVLAVACTTHVKTAPVLAPPPPSAPPPPPEPPDPAVHVPFAVWHADWSSEAAPE
jgi:hypothetical protein